MTEFSLGCRAELRGQGRHQKDVKWCRRLMIVFRCRSSLSLVGADAADLQIQTTDSLKLLVLSNKRT